VLVIDRWKQHILLGVAFRPPQIQSPSIGDAHNPRRHSGVTAKIASLLPHDDESVVDHRIDKVVVAGHPPQKTRETIIVQQVEIVQCLTIPRADALQ
jgi:hypothetical protein